MRLLFLTLSLCCLTGCIIFDKKSEATIFYQFKSPASAASNFNPTILVTRPTLPSPLRRPSVVMLTPEGDVIIDDAHRWVGPLDRLISESVANHLTQITGQATSLQTPDQNHVTLFIEVDHFELVASKKASLILNYHFVHQDGTTLGGGQGTWVEPMNELSAHAFIDAQSQNLAKAAAAMAKTFQNLPTPPAK